MKGENSGNGAKFSMRAAKNWYDYGKTFAEQIDDWKQSKIPKHDTLIVGQTPEVLRKIGMAALPMTIDQTHVGYVLNGSYNADHPFSETEFKNLPDLIGDPVAITASRSHRDTSLVVVIEMKSTNGKQAIASVAVNRYGKMNQERIDAYAITSVHGRNNTISMIQQAAQDEANGNMSVFYWNKNKATTLPRRQELQLPKGPQAGPYIHKATMLMRTQGLQSPRGPQARPYIHSIRDAGSPVTPQILAQTETRQFRRWFGNSKAVNPDGMPKILYHQAGAEFYAFAPQTLGAKQDDSALLSGDAG